MLVMDSAPVNVMELGFEAVNGKGLVVVFSVASYWRDTCSKSSHLQYSSIDPLHLAHQT